MPTLLDGTLVMLSPVECADTWKRQRGRQRLTRQPATLLCVTLVNRRQADYLAPTSFF